MSDLGDMITDFRKSAGKFRDEHGSVEATVAPEHPFVEAGITSIDGVPITAEAGVAFIGDGSDPVYKLEGSLVFFHREDNYMFGSKGRERQNAHRGYVGCECWDYGGCADEGGCIGECDYCDRDAPK